MCGKVYRHGRDNVLGLLTQEQRKEIIE